MPKLLSGKNKTRTSSSTFFADSRIYRLLDANFNRAREGLRIVEDVFRFIFSNQKIVQKLKRIRLNLSKVGQEIYPQLIQARDVRQDFIARTIEKKRENLKDLVIANLLRVEEAIRVMEEFGKLISSEAGYKFKKLRFQVYSLEKEIFLVLSPHHFPLPQGERRKERVKK